MYVTRKTTYIITNDDFPLIYMSNWFIQIKRSRAKKKKGNENENKKSKKRNRIAEDFLWYFNTGFDILLMEVPF